MLFLVVKHSVNGSAGEMLFFTRQLVKKHGGNISGICCLMFSLKKSSISPYFRQIAKKEILLGILINAFLEIQKEKKKKYRK